MPTQWGPLSATDRDFLVKVRLAGKLWELPAGQQAMERAPTQAIKDAGDHLVVGHADLTSGQDVAAKLGVQLPNQPTEQQQGWLRELSAAQGEEYERKFANILREQRTGRCSA